MGIASLTGVNETLHWLVVPQSGGSRGGNTSSGVSGRRLLNGASFTEMVPQMKTSTRPSFVGERPEVISPTNPLIRRRRNVGFLDES
jgi:hypothetical protein